MAHDSYQQNPGTEAYFPSSPTLPTHKYRSKADFEKILLEQYVNRDLVHTAAVITEQENRKKNYIALRNEIEDYRKVRQEYRQWFTPSRTYGHGYDGYGNGFTDGPPKLVYPSAKPRLGHRKTARLRIERKELAQQADQIEELVPIRLEVDWDKIKLRDTFTWNLHDRIISTDLFAEQLVEDLGLSVPPANTVVEQVQHQVRGQLNDFYPQVYIKEDPLNPELPYTAYKNEEMRILIKLNITIGPHTLEDKFEWEINNPLNSPEEFAQSMTRELSLSGEFTTAIAHCIREQSQLFTRSLYIVGHPFDGRPLEDLDLISSFLPTPLPSVLRPQQQLREYGPCLYELTEAELKRSEVIYSREQRRQKRSVNRRGGPVLPDLKDRQRTVRTLVVSSVIPGAAESIEECRLYKRVGPFGRGKRSGARDEDLFDSSDSDESAPESPAMTSSFSGTARTRGMRGAATAAQQRMANLGRSETPEAMIAHHHETRTSARRSGRELPDESFDTPSLIIKLKIGSDRLQKYLWDIESIKSSSLYSTSLPSRSASTHVIKSYTSAPLTMSSSSTLATQTHKPQSTLAYTPLTSIAAADLALTASFSSASSAPTAPTTPNPIGTAAPTSPGRTRSPVPPHAAAVVNAAPNVLAPISATIAPTLPVALTAPISTASTAPVVNVTISTSTAIPASLATGQIGRIEAPPPAPAGQINPPPPQPPIWLTSGLSELLKSYPNDRFEGVMRYSAVNSTTETPCAAPQPGQSMDGIKWMYLPRIRCHDCPGKLYTPGPEATVGNFEVHLKNRQHRERVELRTLSRQVRG